MKRNYVRETRTETILVCIEDYFKGSYVGFEVEANLAFVEKKEKGGREVTRKMRAATAQLYSNAE